MLKSENSAPKKSHLRNCRNQDLPRSSAVFTHDNAPALQADEARALIDAIDTTSLPGLRDRALIGLTVYGPGWQRRSRANVACTGVGEGDRGCLAEVGQTWRVAPCSVLWVRPARCGVAALPRRSSTRSWERQLLIAALALLLLTTSAGPALAYVIRRAGNSNRYSSCSSTCPSKRLTVISAVSSGYRMRSMTVSDGRWSRPDRCGS